MIFFLSFALDTLLLLCQAEKWMADVSAKEVEKMLVCKCKECLGAAGVEEAVFCPHCGGELAKTIKIIIVTRHPALVTYLEECGLVPPGTPVLEHVTAEAVTGKHVIGVLPLHLAALAAKVTEIPLALTPEMRGKELGIEELRCIAGAPVTYVVEVVK